jgi:hypothetical protein
MRVLSSSMYKLRENKLLVILLAFITFYLTFEKQGNFFNKQRSTQNQLTLRRGNIYEKIKTMLNQHRRIREDYLN